MFPHYFPAVFFVISLLGDMSIFLLVDIYTSLLIGVEFLPVWRGISPRLAWNFSHLNPQIVGAVAHKSLKKREKGKMRARACAFF